MHTNRGNFNPLFTSSGKTLKNPNYQTAPLEKNRRKIFGNIKKIGNLGKMEILKKIGNLVKIWKLGKDLKIWKKFRNLGKIWKFGKDLEI